MNRNIDKSNSQKGKYFTKLNSDSNLHYETPFSDYEYQDQEQKLQRKRQLQRKIINKNIASRQDFLSPQNQKDIMNLDNGLNFTHKNTDKERSKSYQNEKQLANNFHQKIENYHQRLFSASKVKPQLQRIDKQAQSKNRQNLQNSLDSHFNAFNIQIPNLITSKGQQSDQNSLNQVYSNIQNNAQSFLYSENGFRQLLQSNQQLQYKISICEYELELLKQKSYQKDQQIRKQKEILKKKDQTYCEIQSQIGQKKSKIKSLKEGYKNLSEQLKKVKRDEKQVRAKKLNIIEQKNKLYQQQEAMQKEYQIIFSQLQNGVVIDAGEISRTFINTHNNNNANNSNGSLFHNGSQDLYYQINDIDSEIQRLKQQNIRLSKQSAKLQKKLFYLKKESQAQGTQRSTIRNRIKQLNQRMAALQSEQQQLLYELSQYQSEEKFKEETQDQLTKNNQQIFQLYGKIQKLQRDLQLKKNTIESLQEKYKHLATQENSLRKKLVIEKQALKNQVKYRSKTKQKVNFQVIDSQYGQEISRQGQFSSRLDSPNKEKQQKISKQNQSPTIRETYSQQYKGDKQVAPLQSILSRYQKIKKRKI